MIYLFQKWNKNWGHRLSEIRRPENLSDFDKLVCVIQHGVQGFYIKISKISQQKQIISTYVLYK